MDNLAKIDLLRERMNVSYQAAKNALESSDWDVVDALVQIEQNQHHKKGLLMRRGNQLLTKARELVRQGNVTRIRVKQDDKVLVEIPVTAGIVGAVLAPELAVAGTVASMIGRCKFEIERLKPDRH